MDKMEKLGNIGDGHVGRPESEGVVAEGEVVRYQWHGDA